jgi:hypothetical protein
VLGPYTVDSVLSKVTGLLWIVPVTILLDLADSLVDIILGEVKCFSGVKLLAGMDVEIIPALDTVTSVEPKKY